MKVDLHFDNTCWCKVQGSTEAIQEFEAELGAWAASFDDGFGIPVSLRFEGDLLVLRGAALDAITRGGTPPPSILTDEELNELDNLTTDLAGFLRPYQAEAMQAVFRAHGAQGIISVPMGGGKTRICAAIAAMGKRYGLEDWLYVVANQELARQAEAEVTGLFPELCDRLSLDVEPGFTAGTYVTAPGPEDRVWSGVLVDECHRLAARTHSESYVKLIVDGPRIGLSGTPLDRTDKKNALTLALLGPVIYETNIRRLEEEGYLAKSSVRHLVYDRDTKTLSKG